MVAIAKLFSRTPDVLTRVQPVRMSSLQPRRHRLSHLASIFLSQHDTPSLIACSRISGCRHVPFAARNPRYVALTGNPNQYLDDFKALVARDRAQYVSDAVLLNQTRAPAATQKSSAAGYAFRLGVQWEVFQGKWHVGAISRAPQKFVQAMQERVEKGIKGDIRSIVDVLIPGILVIPSRPAMQQIRNVLDPDGYNITFKDGQSWAHQSALYLDPQHHSKVLSIVSDPDASSFLDLLKAIRNYIAHTSAGSKAALARCCKQRAAGSSEGLTGSANQPLVRTTRGVRDVGAYLNAVTDNSMRRTEVLQSRMLSVAEMLRI